MPTNFDFLCCKKKKYRSGVLYWVLELEESSAWLQLGRGRRGMGSLLCCLRYPEDGSAAPPVCCFCLPWPFPYHGVDSVCFYHCYSIIL